MSGKGGGALRLPSMLLLRALPVLAALLLAAPAQAACGGIATAYCLSAFSAAETPPGVGTIPNSGFSFQGPGAFSLTLSDPLSGQTGVNVRVTDGGEGRVTTGGRITGTAGDGIAVSSANGPAVAVVGAGGVTATGAGVRAVSGGGGNITVTGAGSVQAGGTGIIATTGGGNVFINQSGTVSGASGITAATAGAGGMTVKTIGVITGVTGEGISTTTANGLNAVVVGAGGVTGATNGLVAAATGTGGLSLSLGGSVTGTAGNGLQASTKSGAATITIDKPATVSGGTNGLHISSATGSAAIVNNGVITSTGTRALTSDMGTGGATLNNNGTLRGVYAATNLGGTLAITNNAAMSGAVATNAGATTNIGNIGAWTNAAGSTITSLNNAGTITLGPAGGTTGTLAVSGNAVFAATSFLTMRISGAASDKLDVGGTTQINGGTLTINIEPGAYTIGQTQQIIASAGAVTGAFKTVSVMTAGYLNSRIVSDSKGVSLTLGYGLLAPAAVTRNQLAVATAFDAATRTAPTGNAGKLMAAIYSQTGKEPLAALNQMNANAPGALVNNQLATGAMFSGALAGRQETMRAPLPPAASTPAEAVTWYTGVPASHTAPEDASRIGVWSSGFGSAGSFSPGKQQGSSGQTHNAKGAALGVDYQIGAFSAGVAGGVSEGVIKAGTASGSTRGVHAGVHAGLNLGDIYASASLSGADYTGEATRQTAGLPGIAAETQSGRLNSREMRGRIEAGMYSREEGFSIAPFVAIEVASLQTGRYTETLGNGAGPGMLSLAYAARSTLSAPVFVGLRLDGNMMLSNGVVLSSKVSVAWKHELSTARAFNAALTIMPDAAFTVHGAKADANALQSRLALQMQISRALAVFASLEGDFSAHHRAITGRGGATLTW